MDNEKPPSSSQRRRYIPAHISEVQDSLTSMVGGAPTFVSSDPLFHDRTLETEFHDVSAGLALVRDKIGESRYAASMAILAEARMLFLADQEDENGKTFKGCMLLWDVDAILEEARNERFAAGILDIDGRLTGD